MGKKKKKGEKDKKSKKGNGRDAVSYEQEIADYNRQLARESFSENYHRLRTRNKELEEEFVTLRIKLKELESDREDLVAHLSRKLQERTEEARELIEKLAALDELRKTELANFKKREEAFESEYRTMENNLSAEVKLAAGKLNALEEWRLARQDLMEKFEAQEKESREQEEKHKASLYEAEKALILGRAGMQRELREAVEALSNKMRSVSALQVSNAVRRTIHENIALSSELETALQGSWIMSSKLKEERSNNLLPKLECQLLEKEVDICLKCNVKQREKIEAISKEVIALNVFRSQVLREHQKIDVYKRIVEETERNTVEIEKKLQEKESELKALRTEREKIEIDNREKEEEYLRLKRILCRARTSLKEALKIRCDRESENRELDECKGNEQEEEEDEESENGNDQICPASFREKLFFCLYEILNYENISCPAPRMCVTIDNSF